MTYTEGFLIPVPTDKREAYRNLAAFAAPIFLEHGALHVVETWGDDVPRGANTDFYMAVKAEEDESVVFSWIVWPSKEVRDAGNAAAMADPRFKGQDFGSVVDGKRMIFGGFTTIVDSKENIS
jgi:uncharacterized protein YbaA (DUF1428 family)